MSDLKIVKKNLKLISAILIIAAGLGYLIFGKLEKNIVYFLTPSELLAKGDSAFEKPVRLGGMVKKDSIQWDVKGATLQFQLTDGMKEISILSHQTPPQMFQEEIGVVVEGKLLKEGSFQAERLMVKHSNEYHPPKEGQKPLIIYKDLVQ